MLLWFKNFLRFNSLAFRAANLSASRRSASAFSRANLLASASISFRRRSLSASSAAAFSRAIRSASRRSFSIRNSSSRIAASRSRSRRSASARSAAILIFLSLDGGEPFLFDALLLFPSFPLNAVPFLLSLVLDPRGSLLRGPFGLGLC